LQLRLQITQEAKQLEQEGRVPWSGVNPEACDLI
jgi:hypothetical protein